jgi:hypothetical protein
MKTIINLNQPKMKTKKLQKRLRIALVAICMCSIGAVNAQRTDTSTNATTDFTKEANTTLGKAGGSVKVIDNKGTIKYLQSNNGVTMFTDTAPDGGIITTWQLGGTLTDDTFIDASGNLFVLDGIALYDPATEAASTNAVDGEKIKDNTAIVGAGFTLLVRDEATGETKKMLMTDLIDVLWAETTLTANQAADFTIPAAGMLATTNVQRVSVYRNGAKLRAGTDYLITAANVVDIKVAEFVSAYVGDVFEVHFIK